MGIAHTREGNGRGGEGSDQCIGKIEVLMSSPRRMESYPDWFMALAQEFNRSKTPPEGWVGEWNYVGEKTLTFATPAEARKVRRNLYGFKAAMFREGAHILFRQFVTIRIEVDGNKLHIRLAEVDLPQPPEMAK